MAAVLRMLFGIALPHMLVVLYPIVFLLAFFVPADFLAVAFDSGGVTTGPMTVPFIMAFGIGFSAVRSDKHAENDSFGLVALCSIGPILAVLILGLIYNPQGSTYTRTVIPDASDSVELWKLFADGIPTYMKEILISLLPIVLFFAVFQCISLKLKKRTLVKILVGIVYNYIQLYRTGAVSHRSKYRIYAGWKLSGTTNCGASLSLDYYPDWHDYGIFYC